MVSKFGDLDSHANSGSPDVGPLLPIPFPALIPPARPPAASQHIKSDASNSDAFKFGAPDFSEIDSAPPLEDIDINTAALPADVRRRRFIAREARLAQDGHTANEQQIYLYLWERSGEYMRAHGLEQHPRYRILPIGYRTVAEAVGLAPSTTQAAIKALQEKYSIQIRPPAMASLPKTFVVFSYVEILRRRRATGLTHFEKRTSGARRLVPSPGMSKVDASRLDAPDFAEPIKNDASDFDAPTPKSGAPNFGAHIRNRGKKTDVQ